MAKRSKIDKAHTKYEINGVTVPSVTTIINNNLGWNKNVLIAWARKIALAGDDPTKVRDRKARIGTLAHKMIECFLKKEDILLDDFSANEINKARICFEAFKNWFSINGFDYKMDNVELKLLSSIYMCGGTVDLIATDSTNNSLTLIDYKTGSGIYLEHKVQVAAYAKMYLENYGCNVNKIYMLHLGQDDGSFSPTELLDIETYWNVFKHCRELQNLKNKLEGKEPQWLPF